MPYIKQAERRRYDKLIEKLAVEVGFVDDILLPGHLNYVVTKLTARVIRQRTPSYYHLHMILNVLPMAEGELRRRILDPYEDKKIEENGDLPELKGEKP